MQYLYFVCIVALILAFVFISAATAIVCFVVARKLARFLRKSKRIMTRYLNKVKW